MSPQPAAQPRPFDGFPTYHAYQACPERSRRAARNRALTASRIRNMRATNRHLSLAQIADHTGVSAQEVKEALGLPPSFP